MQTGAAGGPRCGGRGVKLHPEYATCPNLSRGALLFLFKISESMAHDVKVSQLVIDSGKRGTIVESYAAVTPSLFFVSERALPEKMSIACQRSL